MVCRRAKSVALCPRYPLTAPKQMFLQYSIPTTLVATPSKLASRRFFAMFSKVTLGRCCTEKRFEHPLPKSALQLYLRFKNLRFRFICASDLSALKKSALQNCTYVLFLVARQNHSLLAAKKNRVPCPTLPLEQHLLIVEQKQNDPGTLFQPTWLHLISATAASRNINILSEFHVRQVDVPIVLFSVDDHRQHLGHGVVDALDATVAVGMVGARRDFRMPRSLYTASDSLYQNCSPLSERRLDGHPQRGMHLLTRMSAVPSAMNSATEAACMSARRLNLSVKSKT